MRKGWILSLASVLVAGLLVGTSHWCCVDAALPACHVPSKPATVQPCCGEVKLLPQPAYAQTVVVVAKKASAAPPATLQPEGSLFSRVEAQLEDEAASHSSKQCVLNERCRYLMLRRLLN